MTPRDSEISTPPGIAVVTHFHERHSTKTIPVFLHADGEASWSLLPSSVFLLLGGTVQSENTYSCILKVWESPKISPKVLSHPDDQSFTRFGCCFSWPSLLLIFSMNYASITSLNELLSTSISQGLGTFHIFEWNFPVTRS